MKGDAKVIMKSKINIPEKEINTIRDLLTECENNAVKNNMTSQVWYDTYFKDAWITNFEHGEIYLGEEKHIKLIMEFNPHPEDKNFKNKMENALNKFIKFGEPTYSV